MYIAPNRFEQRARRARTHTVPLYRGRQRKEKIQKEMRSCPHADRSVQAEFSGKTVPAYGHATKKTLEEYFKWMDEYE